MKYKVTNKDKTTQVLYDKGGKQIYLQHKESAIMINPPEESYIFHIEELEKKKSKKKLKGGNKIA